MTRRIPLKLVLRRQLVVIRDLGALMASVLLCILLPLLFESNSFVFRVIKSTRIVTLIASEHASSWRPLTILRIALAWVKDAFFALLGVEELAQGRFLNRQP